MNVSLHQLRVFLAVARQRSFTEAASRLGLSQSAVSLAIRQVEGELGVRLMDRTTRQVQLTEIGASTFSSVARLVEELDAVLRDARDAAAQQRGTARIAVVPSVAYRLMPECINAAAARYPHVRVALDDCSAADVVRKVSQGEVELGVCSGPLPPGDLEAQPLRTDPFLLVMRRDDDFSARRRVKWRELGGRRLIMLSANSGSRSLIAAELERSGAPVEIVLNLAQPHSVKAMVAAGLGLAIMPELAGPLDSDPVLIMRPLAEPRLRRTILLLQRRERSLSPAAAAFREIVVVACGTKVPLR